MYYTNDMCAVHVQRCF